jgi:hypothetical protein
MCAALFLSGFPAMWRIVLKPYPAVHFSSPNLLLVAFNLGADGFKVKWEYDKCTTRLRRLFKFEGSMKKIILSVLAILPAIATAQDISESDMKALSAIYASQSQKIDQAEIENGLFAALSSLNKRGSTSMAKDSSAGQSKIDSLKGTYIVSYTVGTSYTDKIVIDDAYKSPGGETIGKGNYYFGQSGNGQMILCGCDPSLRGALDSDYMCLTSDGIFWQSFTLGFTGSVITGGYYGIGTTIGQTTASLLAKTKPIFRILTPIRLTAPAPALAPAPTLAPDSARLHR